jgi:glucosylceramidase
VKSSAAADGIDNVAFQNADGGSVVLVVVNGNAQTHRLSVRQGTTRFAYDLPAHSVATFEWPPGTTVPALAGSSAPPPPARRSAQTDTPVSATPAMHAAVQ